MYAAGFGTAGYHNDAGFRDVVKGAVLFEVVANIHTAPQCDILIENRSSNLALRPDDAIFENDRVFDNRPAVNLNTSPEY